MYYRMLSASMILIILYGCWDREKDNPFEPEGTFPIYLDVIGYDRTIEISWGDPPVSEYLGFNIFRSETGQPGDFRPLAGSISPATKIFYDTTVVNQQKYFYYVTVIGQDVESKPSKIVSAIPGPGYYWITDNWDYLVARLSYDCSKITRIYYTNYSPYQVVLGTSNIGLILYTHSGLIEVFDTEKTEPIDQSAEIAHPYRACYDALNQCGWVIDTTGVLYRVDLNPLHVTAMPTVLQHPTSIRFNHSTGLIQITDRHLRQVLMIDKNGSIISSITGIQGSPLRDPVGYTDDHDGQRYWLVDRSGTRDIVYSRHYNDTDFIAIDSLTRVIDIEAVPGIGGVWLLSYNGINSSVVQLSASGIRQNTLSSLNYPLDIEVNPYDGTLAVANSGAGQVLHYTVENNFLGGLNNLYLPVDITTE